MARATVWRKARDSGGPPAHSPNLSRPQPRSCRPTAPRPPGVVLQFYPATAHQNLSAVDTCRKQFSQTVRFEVFSQRYERGSTLVTSNLPFDEWTSVFACERLTGALLDRLTHHVHILEMNGESYRLKQSKQRQRQT